MSSPVERESENTRKQEGNWKEAKRNLIFDFILVPIKSLIRQKSESVNMEWDLLTWDEER